MAFQKISLRRIIHSLIMGLNTVTTQSMRRHGLEVCVRRYFFVEKGLGVMAVDVRFTQLHQEWLDEHTRGRTGEARRRLIAGHAYAEQAMLERVWFPAFGNFHFLQPEYEVRDYVDGARFLDFAYIRGGIRIAIEIDPYGTHYAKLDRRQYSNQWVRHMHLTIDGWIIIRISLDDIMERPRLWQQLLQQLIGRLFGNAPTDYELGAEERDILRLALRLDCPIKLSDVRELLRCGYDRARHHLSALEDKQRLIPHGRGRRRIHAWQANPQIQLPPL